MPQGTYAFAGIVDPKTGIYSQSYGTEPDRIVLTFVNQVANIAAGGDVTFSYDGSSIVVTDCKVDQGVFDFSTDGFNEKAILFDRRWRWKLVKKISVHWNEQIPSATNTVRPVTEKTPQQMLTYLFGLLGETVVVTGVPNVSRPEVFADCVDVVDVIDDLVDRLGCRVILGYGATSVSVVEINSGAALPNDGSVSRLSVSWNPPEIPRHVEVVFAPTIYQTRFLTEPVGVEPVSPFEILPIPSLSYTPTETWAAYSNILTFDDLADDESQAARRSVWKWFRVEDGPYTIPGYGGTVDERFQILPLRKHRAVYDQNGENSQVANPGVWGEVYVDDNPDLQVAQPGSGVNTTKDEELPLNFDVDQDNGILQFSRPIRKVASEENADPGLIVEISHHVRNPVTFEKDRYKKEVEIDPAGSGYISICVNVPRISVGTYSTAHALTGSTNNETDLDLIAAAVVAEFVRNLTAYESYVVQYNYLRADISPSGKISQVTLMVSDVLGATTVCGQHMEWDTGAKTYVEKRRDRNVGYARELATSTEQKFNREEYRGGRV